MIAVLRYFFIYINKEFSKSNREARLNHSSRETVFKEKLTAIHFKKLNSTRILSCPAAS